ncbi:MAG: NAD-binding protein [Candidatus Sulfotelmatobacter sp.]
MIILAVIATFGFGLPGMWLYERHASPEASPWSVAADAVYHTLQLLVMESPHLEGHIPWPLHAGRFSGALFFLALTILAFARLFPDEWKFIKLRLWTRNHVVICGLGEVGSRLALEGRKHNQFVVAIENSCSASKREAMREKGVLVLDGDATQNAQLKQARVQSAEFVVASCPEDGTNIAIAAEVGKLMDSAPSRHAQLVCRTLVGNAETRRLLYGNSAFQTTPGYRVNFSDLDRHALAARQALRMFPLDFKPIRENDDTLVRLVVIGFGGIGQSLALHAARIGHFANQVGKSKRLRLTVLESEAHIFDDFKTQYPNLHQVCDFERVALQPQLGLLLDDLCVISKQPNMLVTFAFCCEEDEKNFRFATELLRRISSANAQILCHQETRQGFAALFSDDSNLSETNSRIHAFGMVEDIVNWENLLHENEDKLARALHENFTRQHPNQHVGWDELSEGFRDSNRQAADHIEVKLRALGYHSSPLQKEQHRITKFEAQEIELLAKMEHARWCAERFLDGWTHGDTTDREKKVNRCLVPWAQLPDEEKKKDPEQITAISNALNNIGRGIYR